MKCVTFNTYINTIFFLCLFFLSTQVNAVGISWTHNLNEPTGSPENHYLPNIDAPAIIASGANESATGINQTLQSTIMHIDVSTVPGSVSNSDYFEYQFTTTNTTDLIKLTGMSMNVYTFTKAADKWDVGKYKITVKLDEDPAFGSPTTLRDGTQIDSQNPSLETDYSELKTSGTDYSISWNWYDPDNTTVLNPGTTYTVRVYFHDVQRNAIHPNTVYPDTIIWDDFALHFETSSPTQPPSTLKFVTPGALSCPDILTNGDFESASDATFFGPNRSGSVGIPGWSVSGGGTDTYAVITTGSAAINNKSAYMGSGGVRSVSSPLGAGGFSFDGNGAATNLPAIFEIRDVNDDVASVSGGTPGSTSTCCDYGGEPLVMSQSFTTTPGETYHAQFTVKGEGGTGYPGILKVDVPDGSGHVRIPANDGVETYTVEFAATSTSSTITFTNYGHFYQNSGGWCDPENNGYCTVNGSPSAATTEPTIDDISVASATCVQECASTPRYVFILDDSGSIDNNERAEMTTALQAIADGIIATQPSAEFGVVQFDQPVGLTPNDGDYNIVMGYTLNPTFNIVANSGKTADHMPDSINKMITDGIFSPGGVLASPDAFFLFTDGQRHQSSNCCSVLYNTGAHASTDAGAGADEYADLAQLSTLGHVSLYQVHNPAQPSWYDTPEIVQGTGVHRTSDSFVVPQTDINAFVAGLSCTPNPNSCSTIVTTTDDTDSANNNSGSLRDAIECANSTAGPDSIRFNIPGAGPHTISLSGTPLPTITDGQLTIDGTTQMGASCGNTLNASGGFIDRLLKISIDGSALSGTPNGLSVGAVSDVTIKGLSIGNFNGTGIAFTDSSDIKVQCSHIGVNANGSVATQNEAHGLFVSGVTNANIGDGSIANMNVISGNRLDGIRLEGTIDNVIIDRNYIGLGADGNTPLGNGRGYTGAGISFADNTGNIVSDGEIIRNNVIANNGAEIKSFFGKTDNLLIENNYIGTDATGLLDRNDQWYGIIAEQNDGWIIRNNVVSGMENGSGIEFYDMTNTTIQSNKIGVGSDNTTALGNGYWGIRLQGGAGHVVGGLGANEGNLIAYNSADSVGSYAGILVQSGANAHISGNTIRHNRSRGIEIDNNDSKAWISQNTIFENDGLGIDLDNPGIATNDAGDTDAASEPNGLQNFPVLSSALQVGTDVQLNGSLNSLPSTAFEVELYANQVCNANSSGTAESDTYGEGQDYLSTLSVITDASGNANFSTTIPYSSLTGSSLSSLAINTQSGHAEEGNSSEFSACLELSLCNGFSNEVNVAFAAPSHLRAGEQAFLATTTVNSDALAGHVKAYSVDANGDLSSTANWDAAEQMTSSERAARLYTTNASNNLTLLQQLDDVDFGSNGIPTASTIRQYTFNPAISGGIYLNGRDSTSLLGPISPGSSIALLDNTIDTLAYLDDSAYRTFYNATVANRSADDSTSTPARVIVSSDDGFVYAFNQHDGDLGWGWIPRSLVPELINYDSFLEQHYMQGKIDIMDLKDANGAYASYVIGSYKQGRGQYVLKLSSTSGLDTVIWDVDHQELSSGLLDSAPAHGQRSYFKDGNGLLYAAYVIANSETGESQLSIRSLTSDATTLQIPLSFTASSVPFVSKAMGNNANAPAAGTLFLGSSSGNVYSATLFNENGELRAASDIQNDMNDSAVAALGSGSVTYLGATTSGINGRVYLRAQTHNRLTVFVWDSNRWKPQWTTFEQGAGKWDSEGSYSAVTNDAIKRLPAGVTLSGEATMVADSIVLPVSIEPSGGACYGTAFYYLYRMDNGNFPNERFYHHGSGNAVNSVVTLGYGTAQSLEMTDLPGTAKIMAVGLADQTSTNLTGPNAQFIIKDSFEYGIRGWREIR